MCQRSPFLAEALSFAVQSVCKHHWRIRIVAFFARLGGAEQDPGSRTPDCTCFASAMSLCVRVRVALNGYIPR